MYLHPTYISLSWILSYLFLQNIQDSPGISDSFWSEIIFKAKWKDWQIYFHFLPEFVFKHYSLNFTSSGWPFCSTHSYSQDSTDAIRHRTWILWMHSRIHCFKSSVMAGYIPQNNTGAEGSGEQVGQLMPLNQEINLPRNTSLRTAMEICAEWVVAPSCWNHSELNWQRFNSSHRNVSSIDCYSLSLLALREIWTNNATRRNCTPHCHFWLT